MNFSNNGFSFITALSSSATKAWATSQPGVELIEGFEGVRLKAYRDSAGRWTIGWGSTRYANGTPVKKGDTLHSVKAADDLFIITLSDRVDTLKRLVKVPLNQNQIDSLLSFEYNTGGLEGSTLLRKLNAGDYAGAAAEFPKWNKITDPITGAKKVFSVLTVRRLKEQKLFTTP